MTQTLLNLVKTKRWDDTIRICRSITPSEMLQSDSNNRTSLHIACTLDPPVSVVENLLKYANGHLAARSRGKYNGYIPLHCAIRYKASLGVISLLLDAYSEGATILDKNNWSSIHISTFFDSSVEVVDLLLRGDPSLAKMKTKQDATALHIACSRKVNACVVKSLLRYYPEATKQKMQGKWSPLHLAVLHEAPKSVIILLLSVCPEVNSMLTDSSGQTPLGLYWGNSIEISTEIVALLLDPSTMKDQNHNSGLIHKFLKFEQKIPGLLTFLLQNFAQDVENFVEGKLPLHVAIELNQRHKLAWKKIFRLYPDSIHIMDQKRRLYPFMIASAESNLQLTYELIRLAPDVILVHLD